MEKGMTEITDLVFSKENEERMEEVSVDVDVDADADAKQSQSGKEVEEEEEKENSDSGGIFNNLISSLVSPSSPKVTDEANNGGGGGGGDKRERDGDGGGGGGLIDNIVSHLPSPLADDAAPATEEASILIHSIVHD